MRDSKQLHPTAKAIDRRSARSRFPAMLSVSRNPQEGPKRQRIRCWWRPSRGRLRHSDGKRERCELIREAENVGTVAFACCSPASRPSTASLMENVCAVSRPTGPLRKTSGRTQPPDLPRDYPSDERQEKAGNVRRRCKLRPAAQGSRLWSLT